MDTPSGVWRVSCLEGGLGMLLSGLRSRVPGVSGKG